SRRDAVSLTHVGQKPRVAHRIEAGIDGVADDVNPLRRQADDLHDVALRALRDGDDRLSASGRHRDHTEVHTADLAPGVLRQHELDDVMDSYDGRPGGPDRVGPVGTVQQVDLLAHTGEHDANLFPPDLLDV